MGLILGRMGGDVVRSKVEERSSKNRPLRKALTRVSKASPARSRGALTLRPREGVLKVEEGGWHAEGVSMFMRL